MGSTSCLPKRSSKGSRRGAGSSFLPNRSSRARASAGSSPRSEAGWSGAITKVSGPGREEEVPDPVRPTHRQRAVLMTGP
jgi:hypothetical protein